MAIVIVTYVTQEENINLVKITNNTCILNTYRQFWLNYWQTWHITNTLSCLLTWLSGRHCRILETSSLIVFFRYKQKLSQRFTYMAEVVMNSCSFERPDCILIWLKDGCPILLSQWQVCNTFNTSLSVWCSFNSLHIISSFSSGLSTSIL